MLIPINIDNGIKFRDLNIRTRNFKSLNLKESDIEDFLRENVDIIFGDEESLLIVGQQVRNKKKGRSDLTAIDSNGNMVLIEIKRDIDDIEQRKEPFEFQAIRYAASYAKIEDTDELVDKTFAPYIENYKEEFDLGDLTPYEKGKRIVDDFLEKNGASNSFNRKQRIILVASSFDSQTLSEVAWLISNRVDISCFELIPMNIGEEIFLKINKILPPQSLEDFYVEIDDNSIKNKLTNSPKITRTYLPRMDKLFEWEIIRSGDIVEIKNSIGSEAVAIDSEYVEYKGEKMTFNQWGEEVTKWSAINIYEWTIIKGYTKTLDQLRREKLIELKNE